MVAPPCVIEEMVSVASGFVELFTKLKIPAVLEGRSTCMGIRNNWLLVTAGFMRMAPLWLTTRMPVWGMPVPAKTAGLGD